jgi:cell division protein FtsB
MKWLLAVLAVALLLLQYRIFVSNDGIREVMRLQSAVEAQRADNARLAERNRQLAAEVHDLKQGYAALEERARTELGMIAGNESFYQVVPQKGAGAGSVPAPVPPPPRDVQRTAQATAQAR